MNELLSALIGAFFGWLFAALWEAYRGPNIAVEKITFNNPGDFQIRLRNRGAREAAECLILLEDKPLSEAKELLQSLAQPISRRVEYILEKQEVSSLNILYSCWPITRDVILPDMTDMKPGAAYEFVGRLPDFLEEKKDKLKPGDWNRQISFPVKPGIYVAAIHVYDGFETTFVLVYDHLNEQHPPRAYQIGTIRRPRTFHMMFVWLRVWLTALKYRKILKERITLVESAKMRAQTS